MSDTSTPTSSSISPSPTAAADALTTTSIKGAIATKRQIRGSSLLLFGQLASKGLTFLVQVMIVRYLSKADYGAFAYALSIASLGTTICLFGLDRAVTRFAPIYHEREDYRKMAGTIAMALLTVLLLGLAVIMIFYGLQGYLDRTFIKDNMAAALLLILIFFAPVDALNNLMNGMFAVFSKPGAIFFRKYILGPGLEILVVVLLIVGKSGVRFLAVGYLFSGILAIIIYGAMLIQMLRKMDLVRFFKPAIIQIPAREILMFTIPLLTSDLVYVVMNSVDAILIEYFYNTGALAGLRAVQSTAKLNLFVLSSFALLFTPAAARMFARNDQKGINNLYWQNAVWIAVVTFPIFILSFSLAQPITVLVYGQRYEDSALIMALFSLAYYFNAATGQNGMTLKVFGKLRLIVLINVAAAVLNLLVNLLLIPRYGALGAAFGTFITLIIFNCMKQGGLRLIGISIFDITYLKVYLSIGAIAVALLLVQVIFSPPIYLSIAMAGIGSWLVFRLNIRLLNIEQMFPELLKIPFMKKILGV
jgi:O-antigen/teichoic acid export membrane protein